MSAGHAEPRFPAVPLERGHYESYFLRAGHPTQALAVWIRYTVHKPPRQRPRGSLWFTLFDPAAGPPRQTKLTVGPDELAGGADPYIAIGASRLGAGWLAGSAEAAEVRATWELALEGSEPPFEHLPRPWMYRAPLPRTKLESLEPGTFASGTVAVDDRSLSLERWPAVVGHNWGAEHAERWIWMQAASLDGAPEGWFDAAFGRVRVGPLTLPWVTNGCLSLGGARHRLSGVAGVRGVRVAERASGCEFSLRGDGIELRGQVTAPPDGTAGWLYADPDGGEHNALNCSCASVELSVSRRGEPPLTLRSAAGATYELGLRDRDHGVAIAPFADG